MHPQVAAYFERFGFCERQIALPPHPHLEIVAVIPCFNEGGVLRTLQSLVECDRPACAVEVIVVINSSAAAPPEVLKQNRLTFEETAAWSDEASNDQFRFHILHCPALPPKHAGVGLARKIGMDEAIRRLDAAGHFDDGIIAGFDADCTAARNYLTAIEAHFKVFPNTPGCSVYFEHPLSGNEAPEVYEAATAYELHLRYYVEALRFTGWPHAFHTVGSSMVVRARAYLAQGGMNKRQAGEDFYFLHKVIPLGGFTELSTTTVFPSPRASDRVPFGTGKAVGDCLRGEALATYPLEAFVDIRAFLESVESNRPAPNTVARFLEQQSFPAVLQEIRKNTATPAAFKKRFFRWFDGFMAMKLVHYLRDQHYGERPVPGEATRFLELTNRKAGAASTTRQILDVYREIQRNAWDPAYRTSGVFGG